MCNFPQGPIIFALETPLFRTGISVLFQFAKYSTTRYRRVVNDKLVEKL